MAALGRSRRPLGIPKQVKVALGGPRRVKTCKASPVVALGYLAGPRRVKTA